MEQRKLNKKDYFLLARDIFEDLIYEHPDVSDYLPQLVKWCPDEIKKIDSQKELQRVRRMVTRTDQDWEDILEDAFAIMEKKRGHFFRPVDLFTALADKYVFTEEQLSYRLRKEYENGHLVRKQVPSAKSASMVWGYGLPQEVKENG